MVSSAKSIGNGDDVLLSAELSHEDHYITCYVMCDEIGRAIKFTSTHRTDGVRSWYHAVCRAEA